MLSHAMKPTRYLYIDSLRGWATLLAVFTHAAQQVVLPSALTSIGDAARFGVQLFFVLVALCQMLSWRARGISGLSGLRDYAIARIFRIAPLFEVAIIFYLLLFGWGPRPFAENGIYPKDVALTAVFMHGWQWNSVNSVVPGGWSIGAIASFYIVFPVLQWISRSRVALLALTIGAAVGTQILDGFIRTHHGNTGPLGIWGFPANAIVFLFGLWAARIILWHDRPPAWIPEWLGHLAALLVFLAVVLVLPLWHLHDDVLVYRIQFGLATAALVVLLRWFPVSILVNRPLGYIGRVSYSMYVLHFALVAPAFGVASAFSRMFGQVSDTALLAVSYPLLLAASFGCACITYTLIERPFIRLGRSLIAFLHTGPHQGVTARASG